MRVHPAALLLAVFCAHAEIPRPTGLSKVGRTVLCWSDGSRLEAKANVDDKRPRTVLVSFFYPVQTSAAQEDASAPYVPGLDKLRTVLGDERLRAELGMPYAAATDLRVAASEVPQEQTRDKYPLLLFLPGLMHGSFKYSYQLVDLASHGYIVAAINPPGEVSAFACPDGAVVPRDMSGWGEAQQRPGLDALAFQRERNGVWAEDALFVLHQLLERKRVERPAAWLTQSIDRERVGAFGHSMGGLAAVIVCQKSTHVRACVDQDGASIAGPFTSEIAIRQPFLWIQPKRETPRPPTAAELNQRQMTQEDYLRLTSRAGAKTFDLVRGDGWWLTLLRPADHGSFDDTYLLRSDPPRVKPEETLATITSATRAFFDQHLRAC